VENELRIRTALARLGVSDVLDWAGRNCRKSLVVLNRELDASVAPVDLEHFMRKVAAESLRYDEFVRVEAVRWLNVYFPQGVAASNQQDHGFTAGWAMWASLFGPSSQKRARTVWESIEARMRERPSWCPQGPDDPALRAAFGTVSFQPTAAERRFEEALARMERVTRRANKPWSETKAVENLRHAKPGYGLLYGLLSVDSQVSNGGFTQYFQNTGGAAARLAVDGFRAIGRDDLAEIVQESLRYAAGHHAGAAVGQARLDDTDQVARPFEVLDDDYFSLRKKPSGDWLDVAMIELVNTRSGLF